jgi:glutamyl-Q tRNA(Asp) synthetase
MGSLVAAVGSYLQAKSHHGQWLLRMEDLDPLREEPGSADSILSTLEAHGLLWDGDVVYQSNRIHFYQQALDYLLERGLAYPCSCSRKYLKRHVKMGDYGMIYPGYCRLGVSDPDKSPAIRLLCDDSPVCFTDRRMGENCQRLQSEVGDFIIKRSDGYFAYQLAVVVDDALQNITDIVRGEDLLGNTCRQIYLQQILGYPTPSYLHLPMVKNKQGQKLSKQTHAPALDNSQASRNLVTALKHLEIFLDDAFYHENPERILEQAILHYTQSEMEH